MSYHCDVRPGNFKVKSGSSDDVLVQVKLVRDVQLLPNQQGMVGVKLQHEGVEDSLLIHHYKGTRCKCWRQLCQGRPMCLYTVNQLGFTQKDDNGADIGTVQPVKVVKPGEISIEATPRCNA